jgi:hypothetical protein
VIDGAQFHDLLGRTVEAGQQVNIVAHVETLQEDETVYDHFLREQQAIVLDYLERTLETEPGGLAPPLRRVLVLDIRHTSQSTAEALHDLARALSKPGTYYAPDGRALWDEVRFLEGLDDDPSLSAPQPLP